MEYQWKHVEVFLKRLGFLAEARKLIEDTGLSKDQLVEAISETLEPGNLRRFVRDDNLISREKCVKQERNYRIILARYGIGHSGKTTYEGIGERFGVSHSRPGMIVKRFEIFAFPMEKVPFFLYFIDVADSRKTFYKFFQEAKSMLRRYVNPIKSDLYYRCLEKVCEDPNNVQRDWLQK